MILGAAGGCIQGNLTRPCLLRGGLSRYHALAFVCNVDCATAGGRCRWETIAEEWGIGDKHLFHPWRSDGRVHIVVSWLIYRAPVLLPCYHCGLVCMHIYIGLLPGGSIDAGACREVCVCVSSTAGADGDRLFPSVLPSGTFAADRSQAIVKYYAHAA